MERKAPVQKLFRFTAMYLLNHLKWRSEVSRYVLNESLKVGK
jgi:hypothetical protein